MKSRCAALYANSILWNEASRHVPFFLSWRDFEGGFTSKFCPKNEATAALTKLKSTRYYQGRKTVDDYIDEFSELVEEAGYVDSLSIVIKFWRGLDRDIRDQIAELVQGDPRMTIRRDGTVLHACSMPTGLQIRPSMAPSAQWYPLRMSDQPFRLQGLCFRSSPQLQ
jgi:hypothetical protein